MRFLNLIYIIFAKFQLIYSYIQSNSENSFLDKTTTETTTTSCPTKCECETINSINNSPSIRIFCQRGGLNDNDFFHILQTIPIKTKILEIRAPLKQPNKFQWNDNLNRLSQLKKLILVNCGIPALSNILVFLYV